MTGVNRRAENADREEEPDNAGHFDRHLHDPSGIHPRHSSASLYARTNQYADGARRILARLAEEPAADRQVFVTTVLNPKALIIALVIMPQGGLTELAPWLALFAGLVLLAANGWIAFGNLMRRTELFEVKPIVIRRAAAVCLLLFAMILASASIQSLA